MPSLAEINTLLSNFNASLDGALCERSFSLEQAQDVAAAVAHSLSTIHRYQNALIPVGTLPPEVLIRVFEFVVAPSPDVNHTKPHKSTERAITLTCVCSSWCEIALSISHLRSQVVHGDSPHLTRLFLRRSRAAGIRLFISSEKLSSYPGSVWQDVLQNHSHRVRELHLRLRPVTSTEAYVDALSAPLPALEILTLAIQTNFLALLSNGQFPITPLIFGGQALQNLKTLVLSRVFSFMPGNPLPSLVNLQLHGVGQGSPIAQNLLHLLSNCPRLETFKLLSSFSDPSFDFDNSPNPQLIPLRSLKALWIRQLHITPALALLSRLEFPAETTIRLGNLHNVSEHYELPTSGSFLPAGRPSPLAHITGLTHLDIIETGAKPGHADRTALYFVAHGPRTGIWIHLTVANASASARDRLFGQLLDMLPIEAVATLRMSAGGPTAGRVAGVLRSTPALSTLVLRWPYGTLPSHLGSASALAPTRGEAGDMHIPAPALKSLTVEVNGIWAPQLVDGFVQALETRKRSGYPLRLVAWSAGKWDDPSLAEHLRAHVEAIEITERKLWEMTSIPSVWADANDDGSLYLGDLRYGWQVPRDTYESNSWDI